MARVSLKQCSRTRGTGLDRGCETRVAETHVPDEVYEEARQQFSEKELADLTVAVATINAWNRLAIAGRTTPGTYQPQVRSEKAELKEGGLSNLPGV